MNKIFHFLILVALLLTHSLTVCAADDVESAKAVKIEYQSINEYNQPVTLSATLTFPTSQKVTRVILCNSSTNRLSSALASIVIGSSAIDTLASMLPWNDIALSGFAIIEPDNYVTSNESLVSIPKYTYSLAGRQTIDALYAGVQYLKDNDALDSEGYSTYNIGYGLGANMALAAQRSLEDDYSEEQKTLVNLKSTLVGGAKAAPADIWRSALANDSAYSAYNTVMMLSNVLQAYTEGCMKSFTVADVFSQKLLSSSLLELIYADNFTEEQVSKLFAGTFGTLNPSVKDLLSDGLNQENSPVRRAVEKAIAFNNLTGDWTPQYPIYGAYNDPSLVKQIKCNYTDIVEEVGNININDVVNEIISQVSSNFSTQEYQFLATILSKISDYLPFNLPILAYYNNMIISGNLNVSTTYNVTLTLNIYSLYLSKISTVDISVNANPVMVALFGLTGTANISYLQMGQLDFIIKVSDVMPLIQNLASLMQEKSFATKEEADSVVSTLNSSVSKFTIDVNGQKNWFTGSFGVIKDTTEGTYYIDYIVTRGGKSLSFATMRNYVED